MTTCIMEHRTDRREQPPHAARRTQPCPVCGCPSPLAVVTLPSGRKARIEACAVCGRQDVRPVGAG